MQVEAEDEQHARNVAALRYDLMRNGSARSLGAFAWRMHTLVTCEIVESVDPGVEFIDATSS